MSQIKIIRGDTDSITVILEDDGEPIDLTGATVFFTVKSAVDDDADDSTALISKEVTSHTDPTNGTTVIALTASDTNVTPGTYLFDIQVKKADGTIISIPYEELEILADITRRTT